MRPHWQISDDEKRAERRFVGFMLTLAVVIFIVVVASAIGRGAIAINEGVSHGLARAQ